MVPSFTWIISTSFERMTHCGQPCALLCVKLVWNPGHLQVLGLCPEVCFFSLQHQLNYIFLPIQCGAYQRFFHSYFNNKKYLFNETLILIFNIKKYFQCCMQWMFLNQKIRSWFICTFWSSCLFVCDKGKLLKVPRSCSSYDVSKNTIFQIFKAGW